MVDLKKSVFVKYSRRSKRGDKERFMLKAGQMLAQRYQIQRELGQGGSAKVYLVRDMENGRNRALKEDRKSVV